MYELEESSITLFLASELKNVLSNLNSENETTLKALASSVFSHPKRALLRQLILAEYLLGNLKPALSEMKVPFGTEASEQVQRLERIVLEAKRAA